VTACSTLLAASAVHEFAVARYNTDGSLDGNIDPAGTLPGVATTSFFQILDGDFGYALALQADGKFVVAGQAREPNMNMAFGTGRRTLYQSSSGENGRGDRNKSEAHFARPPT
jgi:hypothetical protein